MIFLIIFLRTIALNLSRKTFTALLAFARDISTGMAAHSSDYASPPVSTTTMDDDNDALEEAIDKWGEPGNRGSHADYTGLLDAAEVVRGNLRATAAYVISATPNSVAKWEAVGFVTKKLPTSAVKLEAVRNFKQVFSGQVSVGDTDLSWKRPANARTNEKINYHVFRADNITDEPEYLGSTNRTKYSDTPGANQVFYYYVIPENAFGEGVITPALGAAPKQ